MSIKFTKKEPPAFVWKSECMNTKVDMVEVVRCKDCKWYDERISICDNCRLPREQMFFCADGKKKEEDDDQQRAANQSA